MQFTKTKTVYFEVLTVHRISIDNNTSDKKIWDSLKSKFEMFYKASGCVV